MDIIHRWQSLALPKTCRRTTTRRTSRGEDEDENEGMGKKNEGIGKEKEGKGGMVWREGQG